MTLIPRALAIANAAHEGQFDKAGEPYILHPMRVALALKTEDERVVALLHDVLEDAPDYATAIRQFPDHIQTALDCLTKRPGEDYNAFIERCASNPLARRVKLADLDDNMNIWRLPLVLRRADETQERMVRYTMAMMRLQCLERDA